MLKTITWSDDCCRLLDQTRLPEEVTYVQIDDHLQMRDAIRRLVIRGAPAIGIAAAFGAYLGVRRHLGDLGSFHQKLTEVCRILASSRPTAVNLVWALERMRRIAEREMDPESAKRALLAEARAMIDQDTDICRRIGKHGVEILRRIEHSPINVLTHCNAGGLATAEYGTALAPIYVGAEQGTKFHVWVDETRPLLQGSRITAFELRANGIPCTLICDNMAASVMASGKVDAVIVGTDRVAANGDVANKIGTLGVAILARHYRIPFLVAAPTSSIDESIASGTDIPIEQRDPAEVTDGFGRRTAPAGVDVFNPAFDVTPRDLVTAIITENGVWRPGTPKRDY